MSIDRAGAVIWTLGALVLVGSAVIARVGRLPAGRAGRMALLWVVIFAILFAIAHWIDRR